MTLHFQPDGHLVIREGDRKYVFDLSISELLDLSAEITAELKRRHQALERQIIS